MDSVTNRINDVSSDDELCEHLDKVWVSLLFYVVLYLYIDTIFKTESHVPV